MDSFWLWATCVGGKTRKRLLDVFKSENKIEKVLKIMAALK